MVGILMVLEEARGSNHGILTEGNPLQSTTFSLNARMGYIERNSKPIFLFLGSNDK